MICSLSRQLGDVDDAVAADVIRAVIGLPDNIELVSLRGLGWPMARVHRAGTRLDPLSLEALAAARHLGAEICLAQIDDNAPLRSAAHDVGVSVRSVEV